MPLIIFVFVRQSSKYGHVKILDYKKNVLAIDICQKNRYTLIDKNNYPKHSNKIMIDTGIVITIFFTHTELIGIFGLADL